MEKLKLELVQAAVKTAEKEALEDRCLRALSKLATLVVGNKFLASTNVGNLIYSLKSNPHLKQIIRDYASRVVTRWKRQLYSPTTHKPLLQNPKSASILKPNNNVCEPQESDDVCVQLRNNIRQQVFEGLNMVLKENKNEKLSSCDPIGVAMCVESTLYQNWGRTNKNYRSFFYNLKDPKNPDFRSKILTGELKAEKIVTMKPEHMASDQRRIQNHYIRETALNKCIVGREAAY